MKIKSLLISYSAITIAVVGCGSGNNAKNSSVVGGTSAPQAIMLPAIKVVSEAHTDATTNNPYINATNNAYYQEFTVTPSTNKGAILNSISFTQGDTSEFQIRTESSLFPAGTTICTPGMTLTDKTKSCKILVKLVNPNSISEAKSSSTLSIKAGSTVITATLNKTPYAYVAGGFSKIYANASESVPSIAASGVGECGINGDKACKLVKYDLASHNVETLMDSDYAVNSLAVNNDGNLYMAGMLTSATVKNPDGTDGNTVSVPSVGSLLLSFNPVINGKINDVLSSNGFGATSYPNDQVYAMNIKNNRLYLAGGFNQMAGVGDGTGFPVVSYDLTLSGASAWSNVFTTNINNPDSSVSAIGFNATGDMYLSGMYASIAGTTFVPSQLPGQFVINKCTTANSGANYTCGASDFVDIDATGNLDGYPQPASSLLFSPSGMLYSAGGFSRIGSVGVSDSANYLIASLPNTQAITGTWSSILTSGYPDNVLGTVNPYQDDKFFTAGAFSNIGTIATTSTESGTCGAGALNFTGKNSCLVANYNNGAWKKTFTTDGFVFSIAYINQISTNLNSN